MSRVSSSEVDLTGECRLACGTGSRSVSIPLISSSSMSSAEKSNVSSTTESDSTDEDSVGRRPGLDRRAPVAGWAGSTSSMPNIPPGPSSKLSSTVIWLSVELERMRPDDCCAGMRLIIPAQVRRTPRPVGSNASLQTTAACIFTSASAPFNNVSSLPCRRWSCVRLSVPLAARADVRTCDATSTAIASSSCASKCSATRVGRHRLKHLRYIIWTACNLKYRYNRGLHLCSQAFNEGLAAGGILGFKMFSSDLGFHSCSDPKLILKLFAIGMCHSTNLMVQAPAA
eukprot:6190872-Pleurochrysis_carterae.AAC.3